jgi:hypothetical protein
MCLTLSYDEINTIKLPIMGFNSLLCCPKLISFTCVDFVEHVIRGGGFNNLTKVIIDIMKNYVNVF